MFLICFVSWSISTNELILLICLQLSEMERQAPCLLTWSPFLSTQSNVCLRIWRKALLMTSLMTAGSSRNALNLSIIICLNSSIVQGGARNSESTSSLGYAFCTTAVLWVWTIKTLYSVASWAIFAPVGWQMSNLTIIVQILLLEVMLNSQEQKGFCTCNKDMLYMHIADNIFRIHRLSIAKS